MGVRMVLMIVLALVASLFLGQRAILRRPMEDSRDARYVNAVSVGLCISLVSFLAAGQFITVLFYPFLWTLVIIHAALVQILDERWPEPVRQRRRSLGSDQVVVPNSA